MNDRTQAYNQERRIEAAQDAFYEVMGGERRSPSDPLARDINFSLLTEFTNRLTTNLMTPGMSVEDASQLAMRQMFPNGVNANGQRQPGYDRGTPNDGLSTDNFDDRYHALLSRRNIPDDERHRGR